MDVLPMDLETSCECGLSVQDSDAEAKVDELRTPQIKGAGEPARDIVHTCLSAFIVFLIEQVASDAYFDPDTFVTYYHLWSLNLIYLLYQSYQTQATEASGTL